MKKKLNKKSAFTLIEILSVIVIMGILTTVGVVAFSNFSNATKEKVTENVYNQEWYATSVCSVSGTTVNNNNGDGGGTCIHRQQNDEIIIGTNIAPYETLISKFKIN